MVLKQVTFVNPKLCGDGRKGHAWGSGISHNQNLSVAKVFNIIGYPRGKKIRVAFTDASQKYMREKEINNLVFCGFH